MEIELLLPVVLKWNLWVAVVLLGGNMAVENSKVGPIEELAQSWQDEIEGRVKGLQTGSYARILKMAKKPSKQEFRQTVIVCGIGMFVLGAIGFLILALMVNVFPPFFQWLIG